MFKREFLQKLTFVKLLNYHDSLSNRCFIINFIYTAYKN
jgi:hypothetical protein